jgi:hypothetical protein
MPRPNQGRSGVVRDVSGVRINPLVEILALRSFGQPIFQHLPSHPWQARMVYEGMASSLTD